MSVAYDAGVLVAADRGDREIWAEHRVRLEAGIVPLTTAPVVAQASRSHRQVQLRRFLRGCEVAPFTHEDAHAVGQLVGAAGVPDVVDAHIVVRAARARSVVLTSDVEDLRRLSDALDVPVRVGAV